MGRPILMALLALLLSPQLLSGQSLANDTERARRRSERALRENIAKSFARERRNAENAYLNSLNNTVKWLASLNARKQAEELLQQIRSINPDYLNLKDAEKAIAALSDNKPLDERQSKELDNRLKSAGKQRGEGLLALASTCYKANLLGYAYDLAWDCLAADPDNVGARNAMAHVKVAGDWVPRFAAQQVQQGQVYLPKFGWVTKAVADKVKAGEWFEDGKKMTLAEADKVHASLENPWVIETENFTLKSTATRQQALAIAERLEAIRSLCFREYLQFFLRGSQKQGAQLLFSLPSQKKLVVHYYGRKEDYSAAVQALKGNDKGILLQSAGFYSPTESASYFYQPEWGAYQLNVMQHEVTHQILGEYSRGGEPPTWICEGAAEVLEDAKLANDGRLCVPKGASHADIIKAAMLLKANRLPRVSSLLALDDNTFHREPGRSVHYAASGALFRFLLEYKDGIYAADVLEYLSDSYRGRTGRLSDYIDVEDLVLDKSFREFLQSVDLRGAPRYNL